jgi:Bacterial Ig domain
MDDPAIPQTDDPAAAPKRRRMGLHVPLPAVLVGLGLVSGPASAQIPVVARPDNYSVLPDTPTVLNVLGNDTLNNAAPTVFDGSPSHPLHGNVVAQLSVFVYTPEPGYRGPDFFKYCIRSVAPLSNSCTTVSLFVAPVPTVPALSGGALAGLSGVLGWLAMRLRRRA